MLQAIGTASFAPRAVLMSVATWWQASGLRLDTTTAAPCSARRSAIALPIPLVEPVTTATFPERSKSVIARFYQSLSSRGGLFAARGEATLGRELRDDVVDRKLRGGHRARH